MLIPSILATIVLAGCQTFGGGARMEGPVASNAARCAGYFAVTERDPSELKVRQLQAIAEHRAATDNVPRAALVSIFNDGSATAASGTGEAFDALAQGCPALYEELSGSYRFSN